MIRRISISRCRDRSLILQAENTPWVWKWKQAVVRWMSIARFTYLSFFQVGTIHVEVPKQNHWNSVVGEKNGHLSTAGTKSSTSSESNKHAILLKSLQINILEVMHSVSLVLLVILQNDQNLKLVSYSPFQNNIRNLGHF